MSSPKRIDAECVRAINVIQKEIEELIGVKVPFIECSKCLGNKYFRGQLGVITRDELIRRYKPVKIKGYRNKRNTV